MGQNPKADRYVHPPRTGREERAVPAGAAIRYLRLTASSLNLTLPAGARYYWR